MIGEFTIYDGVLSAVAFADECQVLVTKWGSSTPTDVADVENDEVGLEVYPTVVTSKLQIEGILTGAAAYSI